MSIEKEAAKAYLEKTEEELRDCSPRYYTQKDTPINLILLDVQKIIDKRIKVLNDYKQALDYYNSIEE